jgi:MFS family permease
MPTLPTYVQTKTSNLAAVGAILSMYGLWQAVVRLPLGIAADCLGQRKPFIIGGLLLAAGGAWAMGAARDVTGLTIGRAVTGLAAGTWVPLVVVFSSLFPPEEAVRASTILTLFNSIGRVLATAATGSLNAWGGYALAFFLAAGAALLAAALVLPVREERRAPRRLSLLSTGRLITRRDVLLPSVLGAISQHANWAATFGFVPILARQLGANDVLLSALVTVNLAVLAAGNLVASAMVRRVGAQKLVCISFVLLGLGVAGLAVAPSLALVFVCQVSIGLSQGFSYPVLMGMAIRHVNDAERTTAMGLHQAVYAIGMFSGPAASGLLAAAMGIRAMFGVTSLSTLIAGLGLALLLGGADRR